MNICFVTPEFITEKKSFDGGLSNYLFRVSLSLKQLGHTPIIVVASECTEVLYHEEIEVHRVLITSKLYPKHLEYCLQSFELQAYVDTIILEKKIAIIQYANFTFTSLYRNVSIPTICRISSYERYLDKYYDWEIPPDEAQIKYSLEKMSLTCVDAIIGPSTIIAEAIQNDLQLNTIEVIETPFFNDVLQLDESVYKENLKDKKYFLFFGTIGILKGIKSIAAIIDDILGKYPEYMFVFVGKESIIEGQKAMDYIMDKAPLHKNRIKNFPALTHERLYPIIANAQVCILPSRIDNFPNCCIEAMYHKKIVIGTKDTGFNQLIVDGINGFLCERDNPEDLLKTIEKVLQLSPDVKNIIGNEALRRVELLSPENVVTQLIDFYQKTIQKFDALKALKQSFQVQKFVQQILFQALINQKVYFENITQSKDTIIEKKEHRINEILNSKTFKFGEYFLSPIKKIFQFKL